MALYDFFRYSARLLTHFRILWDADFIADLQIVDIYIRIRVDQRRYRDAIALSNLVQSVPFFNRMDKTGTDSVIVHDSPLICSPCVNSSMPSFYTQYMYFPEIVAVF
jgi:hypothetical protein